jgi:hypothetical protein
MEQPAVSAIIKQSAPVTNVVIVAFFTKTLSFQIGKLFTFDGYADPSE